MYKIGSLILENPFILAPLAGVTDAPFRRLCKEQGASLVYSEMVSCKGLIYRNRNTEDLLKIYDEEKPVTYQLFGGQPEVFGAAAKLLSDRDNAALDINMGCPVHKIVSNGEGAALLKTPDMIGRIVDAVVRETKKPVTVKIRSGWDGQSINAAEVAKIAESAGAAAIAVHARTREQFYGGKADWQVIRDVKNAVSVPVIGNGDVFSGEDAIRMIRETGCDFVMIARGALGNPWIFREALSLLHEGVQTGPPTMAERREAASRHFSGLVEVKGEYAAVREMRKHLAWYFKGVPYSSELRRRANVIGSAKELFALIGEEELRV